MWALRLAWSSPWDLCKKYCIAAIKVFSVPLSVLTMVRYPWLCSTHCRKYFEIIFGSLLLLPTANHRTRRLYPSMQPWMGNPYGFSLLCPSTYQQKVGPGLLYSLCLRRCNWRSFDPSGSIPRNSLRTTLRDTLTWYFLFRSHHIARYPSRHLSPFNSCWIKWATLPSSISPGACLLVNPFSFRRWERVLNDKVTPWYFDKNCSITLYSNPQLK